MQNEQYPMPAMTEQERQELIRFNVAKLRAITPQFMKEKSPGVKKHLQSEINSAKISLAALTAPPVQVLRPVELPDWQKEAETLAEQIGVSFVVFQQGQPPQVADTTKVRIEFTDKGLGHEVKE